ncbi:MAG: dihydroorotate dehydrogenase electron transfer subunit [archaeon]
MCKEDCCCKEGNCQNAVTGNTVKDFSTVRVIKIVQENPNIKTFYFDKQIDAKPGQFVMVWLPEVNEKPFAFSNLGKDCSITVQKRGSFTEQLFKIKEGTVLGVRGPFGKGFEIEKIKNAAIIAGGCGIAPLKPLAEELKKHRSKVYTSLGARNKEFLFFEREFGKLSNELEIFSEDGSVGKKGYPTEALEEFIKSKKKIDCVFACGPEILLKKIFDICEKHKIICQISLERYMKCGIGICGQCAIDDQLICKDGPVFYNEQLRKSKEFGKSSRNAEGKKSCF